MSPELEADLAKFLARQKDLEPTLRRIADWQSEHVADHAKERVNGERHRKSLDFRVESLEQFSPRRLVRLVTVIGFLVAVVVGYEVGTANARMATQRHLVP